MPDMTTVSPGADAGKHVRRVQRADRRTTRRAPAASTCSAEWTEDVDLLTEDEPRMQALGTAVPHAADAFGFDI